MNYIHYKVCLPVFIGSAYLYELKFTIKMVSDMKNCQSVSYSFEVSDRRQQTIRSQKHFSTEKSRRTEVELYFKKCGKSEFRIH
jgi:hypothetical protein